MTEQQEVTVKEYDYDEEFRHLGYTASIVGKSSSALRDLSSIAQRAKHVFFHKHSLRDSGASIVKSCIVPKIVYPCAFAKATHHEIANIEAKYGDIVRRSVGVALGFPWEVLCGSPEYDGIGMTRLSTEVTKARLRQFQSLICSKINEERLLAFSMLWLAQRWCGSSTPVTMISSTELNLFQPLDATAPQAAHMLHERAARRPHAG